MSGPGIALSYLWIGPGQAAILMRLRSVTPEGKIKIKSGGEDSLKILSETFVWSVG